MRLGTQVGYREFKKAFDEARQVRVYAVKGNFVPMDVVPSETNHIQKIRELAQQNYTEKWHEKSEEQNDLHISEPKHK